MKVRERKRKRNYSILLLSILMLILKKLKIIIHRSYKIYRLKELIRFTYHYDSFLII